MPWASELELKKLNRIPDENRITLFVVFSCIHAVSLLRKGDEEYGEKTGKTAGSDPSKITA